MLCVCSGMCTDPSISRQDEARKECNRMVQGCIKVRYTNLIPCPTPPMLFWSLSRFLSRFSARGSAERVKIRLN